MPYVDDFERNDEEGGVPAGAAPSVTSSGAQGQKPKTPGRFANLSEYLRVNSPLGFGSQVAGKVNEDIQKGQTALNEADTEFKSRVDSGTVKDTDNLTEKVKTAPTEVNQAEWNKIYKGEYAGPNSFNDAADLSTKIQGQAGSALQKAKAGDTEGGRFALLSSYFNTPKYSQGQKSLDNLLIQNDPNSRAAFSDTKNQAKNLNASVKQADDNFNAYAAQARQASENVRKGAREAIGVNEQGSVVRSSDLNPNAGGPQPKQGAIGDLLAALEGALQIERSRNQVPTSLSGFGLDPNQFTDIRVNGIQSASPAVKTPGSITPIAPVNTINVGGRGQTFGIKPSDYYRAPKPQDFTLGNVATPEQRTNLKALEQLAGIAPQVSDLDTALPIDQARQGQFDKETFMNAYNQARQAYQGEVQALIEQMNQLTNPKQMNDGFAAVPYTVEEVMPRFNEALAKIKQKYGVA